jgi:hypothetical protein
MLFNRQRQLLALLDALGGSAGKLDFQKLLFLYSQDPASGAPYDFVPYKYGAFSFTSYADRRKLIERGMLADDDQAWTLTDAGRDVLGGTTDMHIGAFVRQLGALRGNDLVALTYRRYPFTATRSEIAERVLQGDAEAIERIESAKTTGDGPAIQTIGYEGHSLESYLNVLLHADVTLLCDVRRNPISRKYGFSKKALSRGCDGVGLKYEHLPELGIDSRQRRNLNTQADYDALFVDYRESSLPLQTAALETLKAWADAGERIALTCYEHLPQQCHRHCVADALAHRFGKGFSPTHL